MIHVLLIALLNTGNLEKPKLIYVGDPMCSWCYGIAPELESLKAEFDEILDFELVLGGLRPYNNQTMRDLKDFLSHHWEEVRAKSEQEFNFGILDKADITYDTEPPCRANMIVREMDSSKSFAFFHATQIAFYKENRNMHLVESYESILENLKIDKASFNKAFKSIESQSKIKVDFERSESLGVNSFPTILLEYKGEFHTIAKGYSTKDIMTERIQKILNR